MSFSIWAAPFVDAVSSVTAAWFNKVRTELAAAIDGGGGGAYAPTSVLEIGGSGLRLGGTANLLLASRAVSRENPGLGFAWSLSANWERYTTPADAWRNITAAGGTLVVPLIGLPKGNVLNTVTVVWTGGGGHGALPVMPTIQVFSVNGAGTETSLAAATSDPSGTIGAYEVQHNITTGALAHTIDTMSNRYIMKIITETGGDWRTGSLVQAVITACTVTTMTEY